MSRDADLIVVGAGAAGLMAALWAARTDPSRRVVLLDGARVLGAKILVSGGGRCNVTHHHVDETAFAGSTRAAIRKVLRRFDVARTVAFFRELGVELKREETGKLFPVTDRARTVLDALVGAVRTAGVELRHPWRVTTAERESDGFRLASGAGETLRAARVLLATGGMSLPKTGSDGGGYALARALGHSLTPRIFPGLVPLRVADGHFVRALSGIAVPVALELRCAAGAKRMEMTGALLCTHFGISGPVRRPGVVEVKNGVTLNHLLHDLAGGSVDGRPLKGALVGGPSGSVVPAVLFDVAMEPRGRVSPGTGGIVAVPAGASIADIVRTLVAFNARESCGKCTPCREGLPRLLALLDEAGSEDKIRELGETIQLASLCGLGQAAPIAVQKAFEIFGDELRGRR